MGEHFEGSREGSNWVQGQDHGVLNFLLIWGHFAENSWKKFVEGVEDVLVNEVVVGEVDNSWDDHGVEGLKGFFDALAGSVHGFFEEVLDVVVVG